MRVVSGANTAGEGALERDVLAAEDASLVLAHQRHLKWRGLDVLERTLMVLCGISLFGFTAAVLIDIVTRALGVPWLPAQEVIDTFFIYGIFIGAAVATRRNDHLMLTAIADNLRGTARQGVELLTRLVVLAVALCMVWFGWLNFLTGLTSYRMPSMTPIASLYAAIPLSGALIALFTLEQMVNGWRRGFAPPASA
ncbi:MAG: TRAP transporter small permease [Acetobacteraceae bacterium]|nr:TRAP transporter small permease [Acetobacteraceae bacterium]